MEALQKGLAKNSLLEFYYLARAVLVKTEADFDRFDQVFLDYFKGIKSVEEIPREFYDWLQEPKEMKPYDKAEVDARTKFDLDKLLEMLEERLGQQKGRHDGGQFWVGTGGTSVLGHSGYAATGIRVGGEGGHRTALQVAGDREYRDFREDLTLDLRTFQMAFRHLRQQTAQLEGPKDQLNLEETIEETGRSGGYLRLVFDRPRQNNVKVLLLFDSGGSMMPYSRICSQLFQAVNQANHFKDLHIYYFHNCVYEELYTLPSCRYDSAVSTQWVLNNLGQDYKVIFIGDAAMADSELFHEGGNIHYGRFNEETGISWLLRFKSRFQKLVWFNPIPKEYWPYDYGAVTIEAIGQIFPMHHLSAEGLARGLKELMRAR
ncbi:MAG: hypothetical protein H6Q61_549 [Firmicutes bacterium]|nr:hypothetical protein [Bacillota bacterium]